MSEVGGSHEYRIRKKEVDELKDQASQAEGALGSSLNLPSKNGSLYEKSEDDLKEKYPVRYEAYVTALRAARQGQEVPMEQREAVGRILRPLNNLDDYIKRHQEGEVKSHPSLRDRQLDVFEDIREHLEHGEKEGYVKLPTGFGKTVLFTELVEAMDVNTLIVVPTQTLLDQTEKKIHEYAPDLKYGKVYSHSKDFGEQVTITTYDSLQINLNNGNFKPEDFDLVILDEAHRALSEKASEAVEKFDNTIKIGLTATPEYSKDKQLSTLLTNEIHSMELPEAIKDGLLSSVSVYLVKTSVDVGNIKITASGNYDEEELEKALNIASRNEAAVKLYEQSFKGEGCTVYCLSINHAKKMAEMFNENGLKAAVIYGDMTRVEKDKIIKRYEDKEIDILCNANLLIEGFDAPRTNICLNLRPTRSKVVAEQRAGRALRLDDDNPNKMAYVVDFVDEYREDSNQNPILFSEILGAAEIMQNSEEIEDEYEQIGERKEREGGGRRVPNIDIEGIEVVFDAQEIMQITNEYKSEEKQFHQPPEGWLNISQIAKILEASSSKTANMLKSLHFDSGESGLFSGRTGEVKFYNPSVLKKLEELLGERPPTGWKNFQEMARDFSVSTATITNKISVLGLDPDEWGEFRGLSGTFKYYAPSVMDKLGEVIVLKKPPEGWMNLNQLSKELNISYRSIQNRVEMMQLTPQEQGTYKSDSTPASYYAPSVLERLSDTIEKKSPEGWMNLKQLAKEFSINEQTISSRLNMLQPTPQEHGQYRSVTGLSIYYSPSIVERLGALLAGEKVPEGWMNVKQLAKELSIADQTAARRLKNVQLDPSEHGRYRSSAGMIPFYAPSVLEKLQTKLK